MALVGFLLKADIFQKKELESLMSNLPFSEDDMKPVEFNDSFGMYTHLPLY